MSAIVRVVDVYPYRRTTTGIEFLLLRRAGQVLYAGQWRMVGGKIAEGEAAWETALRELEEETGHRPTQAWSVPSVNTFYEWTHDRVNLIPVFAAELGGDPVLNHEHDAFAWLAAETACARLVWPEHQRLTRLIDTLLAAPLPPDWLLPT